MKKGTTLEVPTHLKDANYPGAKRLGHGEGYQYAHNFPGGHVQQDYLPAPPDEGQAGLPKKRRYYEPTAQGLEQQIKARLDKLRRQ